MRALVLSDSAAEKLARLLLGWLKKTGRRTEQNIHLKLSLTRGEIAQMIGVSRETVTRLLRESHDNICGLWRAPRILQTSAPRRQCRRSGSVATIHLPHKILWQGLIHSRYRMWLKYFLQQSLSNALSVVDL
jgi:hypothetical protein